jgi:dynein heavy chain
MPFRTFAFVGIFERHKLLFSFQMAVRLEESEGNLTQKELEFFIKGNVSVDKAERKCPFTWLSEKVGLVIF